MKRMFHSLLILCAIVAVTQAQPQTIQSPSQFTGVQIGADYQLVDYHQIVDYLKYLDEHSSRLKLRTLGQTTMGNPFVMVIISSEKNMAQLEYYRQIQDRLADPRGLSDEEAHKLIAEGRTVVLLNCAIHSTEIASTQMAPKLAFYLATSDDPEVQEILDNVIVLLVPAHNPDGQLLVTEWYRKYVHTPYEHSPLPFLYHKYVGHDNNRDWFMFTQKETRITVEKIHLTWHPQIVHDLHQMGQRGARMFLPPYIDPVEPNVPPLIISQLNMLGETMAAELIRNGKPGVVTNAIFDAWTPARAFQHYHGGVRILSEAASAWIASPVVIKPEELRARGSDYNPRVRSVHFPVPWPGGEWHLQDIIDYEWIATLAELKHAARNREEWLTAFYRMQKKNCEPDRKIWGYVLHNDARKPTEIAEFLDVLQEGGVEVYQPQEAEQVGKVSIAPGDFLIPVAQPYGPFARALLQKINYPAIMDRTGRLKRPYDVTTHNLPLLLGVTIDTLHAPPAEPLQKMGRYSPPQERIGNAGGRYLALAPESYGSDIAVIKLLQAGKKVLRVADPLQIGKEKFAAGTYLLPNSEGARNLLARFSKLTPVAVRSFSGGKGLEAWKLGNPRIGLYHGHVPSMDEGWTRWIFDHYGIRYTSLSNRAIRGLNSRKSYDVVLFAEQSPEAILNGFQGKNVPPDYRGGIGEDGVRALREFVRNGGTVVAWGRATRFFVDQFWLNLSNAVANLPPEKYYVPGSLLWVKVDPAQFLGYGFGGKTAVLFAGSPVFEVQDGHSFVRFADRRVLACGWLTGEKYIAGKSVGVEVPFGKGRLILLGFRPQFRAQARASYKFLFNAILRSVAKPATL